MRTTLAALFVLGMSLPASADGLAEHDYILNCAGCHRVSGLGSATVPSLHGITTLPRVAETRAYLVRVPGVAHAPLTDARLAALINWVVERFTGRAPAPEYTADEVSTLRRDPFLDPLGARARLEAKAK